MHWGVQGQSVKIGVVGQVVKDARMLILLLSVCSGLAGKFSVGKMGLNRV